MPRSSRPDDPAAPVIFLLSNGGANISETIISVDGSGFDAQSAQRLCQNPQRHLSPFAFRNIPL
jgi:hypothetical protein